MHNSRSSRRGSTYGDPTNTRWGSAYGQKSPGHDQSNFRRIYDNVAKGERSQSFNVGRDHGELEIYLNEIDMSQNLWKLRENGITLIEDLRHASVEQLESFNILKGNAIYIIRYLKTYLSERGAVDTRVRMMGNEEQKIQLFDSDDSLRSEYEFPRFPKITKVRHIGDGAFGRLWEVKQGESNRWILKAKIHEVGDEAATWLRVNCRKTANVPGIVSARKVANLVLILMTYVPGVPIEAARKNLSDTCGGEKRALQLIHRAAGDILQILAGVLKHLHSVKPHPTKGKEQISHLSVHKDNVLVHFDSVGNLADAWLIDFASSQIRYNEEIPKDDILRDWSGLLRKFLIIYGSSEFSFEDARGGKDAIENLKEDLRDCEPTDDVIDAIDKIIVNSNGGINEDIEALCYAARKVDITFENSPTELVFGSGGEVVEFKATRDGDAKGDGYGNGRVHPTHGVALEWVLITVKKKRVDESRSNVPFLIKMLMEEECPIETVFLKRGRRTACDQADLYGVISKLQQEEMKKQGVSLKGADDDDESSENAIDLKKTVEVMSRFVSKWYLYTQRKGNSDSNREMLKEMSIFFPQILKFANPSDFERGLSMKDPLPDFGIPHGVWLTGAPALWHQGYTGSGCRVAIIDGGVDPTHEDLLNKVEKRVDFVPPGTVFDLRHGTHVAGIIAGNGCLRGVAPDATICDYRVQTDGRNYNTTDVAKAVLRAVEDKCNVINMSIMIPPFSLGRVMLENAVKRARAEGVVVVAAAGSVRTQQKHGSIIFPACFKECITVAALDYTIDAQINFTNCVFSVESIFNNAAAAGFQILSAAPNNQHALHDGTSMAAPHVAGMAALLHHKAIKTGCPRIAADGNFVHLDGMIRSMCVPVSVPGGLDPQLNPITGAGLCTFYSEVPARHPSGHFYLPRLAHDHAPCPANKILKLVKDIRAEKNKKNFLLFQQQVQDAERAARDAIAKQREKDAKDRAFIAKQIEKDAKDRAFIAGFLNDDDDTIMIDAAKQKQEKDAKDRQLAAGFFNDDDDNNSVLFTED